MNMFLYMYECVFYNYAMSNAQLVIVFVVYQMSKRE